MKEIKLKEIKPGMVIHCKTEEEAELFYKWLKEKENITDTEKIELQKRIMNAFQNNYCFEKEERLCRVVVNWGDEAVEFSDLILPETMTEEEAYKKGREDALEEVRNCEAYGYDCGLKDAWELVKKIIKKDWTFADARDCFGLDVNLKTGAEVTREIFNIPYHEVFARFEAYEKEKEIKQWDVVEYGRNNVKILVTEINEETFSGIKITPTDEFGKFGGVYSARNLTDCKKTNYKADLTAILAEIGKE